MPRCLPVLLAAGVAATAASVQAQTLDNPFGLPAGSNVTLELIDTVVQGMRSMVWTAPGFAGHPVPDHRGRSIQQDLDEYVQTDGYLAEIAKVRDALAAAMPEGATEIPAAAAEPVRILLATEGCRFLKTFHYWHARTASDYHWTLIQPLVRDLPAAERPAAAVRLQALQDRVDGFGTRLADDVASCARQIEPDTTSMDALFDDYNTLRAELADRLYELKIDLPDSDEWVERPDPCPAPATTTSGELRAKVAERADMLQYYDEESRENQVAGRSYIRLQVSSTGCVVRASVTRTSGAPLLDKDALQVAFSYRFIPGEQDGKPIGQHLLLPVSFSAGRLPPDATP